MGIYDRDYYRDESSPRFSLGGSRTMVTNLLIINVGVFVIDALLGKTPDGGGVLNSRLAVSPETLLQPWYWWRFLTYGFAHANPAHIFGNMLGLFFFGRSIEAVYGSRKFLGMYLTSILAGSLVWACRIYFTAPQQALAISSLVGASCAITTIVILFCFHFPHQKVLFMMVIPMPAWVLGVLLIFMNVSGQLQNDDNIAYGVHLVGAAYAYLFYRTRIELGQFFLADWFSSLIRLKPRPKLRVHKPSRGAGDDQIDLKADTILEKLHREGESSLSAAERRTLEEYSRRMKQKRR